MKIHRIPPLSHTKFAQNQLGVDDSSVALANVSPLDSRIPYIGSFTEEPPLCKF